MCLQFFAVPIVVQLSVCCHMNACVFLAVARVGLQCSVMAFPGVLCLLVFAVYVVVQLSVCCHMNACVFLAVPRIGLQCSVMAFPGVLCLQFFAVPIADQLSVYCHMNACVFLAVPWVGLQCSTLAFPGLPHICFVSAVFRCTHRGSTVSLLPYECLCLPRGAADWSAVFDCGISWSSSHKFCVCCF